MAPDSLELSQLHPNNHSNSVAAGSATTLSPASVLDTTTGSSRPTSSRNRRSAVGHPSIRSRVSVVPPPGAVQPLQFNAADIFKVAFPLQDKEIPELLECDYDSMAAYQLTPDEEADKVRLEIDRLISIVQKSDNTLLFTSRNNGCLAALESSKDGYVALADVVANVRRALRVCDVDNDGISLLNAKIDTTPRGFEMALRRLSPDFYIRKKPQATQTGPGEAIAAPAAPSYESCCDLVDFLTASLARVMTQMAGGYGWNNSVPGVLAKLAAKMKVLLDDLDSNCVTAKSNGEFTLESYIHTFGDSDGKESRTLDPETVFRELSKSSGQGAFQMHCVEQQRIRSGPVRLFQYLLQALGSTNNESGMPVTAYEMLSVVIDTGYEGFKAHLCQDRDYEFSSTSDQDDLNFSHPGFNVLVETIEHIFNNRSKSVSSHPPPPSSPQAPTPLTTTIEWVYATDGLLVKNAHGATLESGLVRSELHTMGEIISVMTPLFLTSPYIAHLSKSFLNMFYLTADLTDEVRPYPEGPYNAFIRLYTSAYKAPSATDVLQLADAIRQDLFSRDFLLKPHASRGGIMPALKALLPQKRTDSSQRLHRLMDEMSAWVYIENAVIIRCRFYVFVTMALAGVLVGGGLAIGLTLETRLRGVDPFNITVYAWALAAFLALVSKSIKVRDWAWADFLHGRVVCRSVSELSSMTGYSDQLILAKLLHDERESILITRGPYNSVFERRAEGNDDGFSIDLPVKTRTLLLSGLTMLKVETPLGHGLVCLDARRGHHYSVVCHRNASKESDELICQDIDRLMQSKSSKRHNKGTAAVTLPMKWSKELEWRRVEGVYSELDAAFV